MPEFVSSHGAPSSLGFVGDNLQRSLDYLVLQKLGHAQATSGDNVGSQFWGLRTPIGDTTVWPPQQPHGAAIAQPVNAKAESGRLRATRSMRLRGTPKEFRTPADERRDADRPKFRMAHSSSKYSAVSARDVFNRSFGVLSVAANY